MADIMDAESKPRYKKRAAFTDLDL